MRYVNFAYQTTGSPGKNLHLGALSNSDTVIDLEQARLWAHRRRGLTTQRLPDSLYELLAAGPPAWEFVHSLVATVLTKNPQGLEQDSERTITLPMSQVDLLPPLLRPMSLRDFYAFERHVVSAHAIRGKTVSQEWYQFPVFYFSNPNAVYGPDEIVPCPAYTQELDYELEVACVIDKAGINIPAERAEEYIFGYTIMNDWSARDVQRQEMRVGLGPAKGKDFATSLGPWLVTPDELSDRHAGRPGVYNLGMTARVNGEECSSGNWQDLYYSFGEMIARASQDAYLLPGDVIGSGTVGTGCLLEVTQGQGPWLQPGDLVELEIERLGKLVNRVGKSHARQSSE